MDQTNATIPPVDPKDLKAVWENHSQIGGRLDPILVEKVCTPNSDVTALGCRASFLIAVTTQLPGELESFLQDGKPTDALFEVFARAPIPFVGSMNLKDILEFRDDTHRDGVI